MKRIVAAAILFLLCAAVPAWAHPPVGIVMDRQGNVFYSDLSHVWRISPDGRKTIAVRDVHTHELALDSAGNLYGEDNRYQGGDRYRHRIWRRSPNGRVTDVVPWTEGFWPDYGFVRDRAGAMYWVSCPERVCTIRRRSANGRTTVMASGARLHHNVQRLAAASDGSLYVLDGADLRRITPAGRLTTAARGLGSNGAMGMWPDAEGGVFVALAARREIARVRADGRVTTVARTPGPWAPSGVMVAPDGSLWLLEYSPKNEIRVRHVARNGRARVY